MRAVALTIVVAAAGVLLLPAATASARTTKGCPPHIHNKRWGGADHIRVTKSYTCKRARRDVRRWLADMAPGGPTNKELKPWTCKFGQKPRARNAIRCKLRKAGRTYRMRFVYDLRG